MTRLDGALARIDKARSYSLELIECFEPADWFRQPAEGVTHLAWQVGHLAIAEFGLALVRVRGKREEDSQVIPPTYAALFGKGSTPLSNPAGYPAPEEIRAVLNRVHQRVLSEARGYSDQLLDEPAQPPHPAFQTRFGALEWCAAHEMLHAGQIGLLRRLFGQQPLR